MLLDIKVNNQWYRFRRSWWSDGTLFLLNLFNLLYTTIQEADSEF